MRFRADPSKEYYAIIGLKEDASPDEIRRAYRKLALHYHPDRNRGDAGAEERFKAISEAYAVLIDPEKRREYDLSRQVGVGAPGREQGSWDFSSQEDILRDLLRNQDAAAIFQELTREFQRMGFRFDDGFVRHMFFGGRGLVFGGIFFGGPFAWGRGGEVGREGGFGRRIEPWGPWRRQAGAGAPQPTVEPEEREQAGMLPRLGQAVRGILSGLGRVAGLALGRGERGEDLRHDLTITPEEARTGAKKQVRFVRGTGVEELIITIPSGIRHGTRLRLRGKGLAGKTGAPGDLYLRIRLPE